MLKHLARPRISDVYKEFTYTRILVPSKITKHKIINWEIHFNGSYVITLETLKEVKRFISEKANT